jgi:hypothetical protein
VQATLDAWLRRLLEQQGGFGSESDLTIASSLVPLAGITGLRKRIFGMPAACSKASSMVIPWRPEL